MNDNILYPNITVKLVGEDGNAFSIMGAVAKALRLAGVEKPQIELYMKESTSGDYNNLLITAMKWVNVEWTWIHNKTILIDLKDLFKN